MSRDADRAALRRRLRTTTSRRSTGAAPTTSRSIDYGEEFARTTATPTTATRARALTSRPGRRWACSSSTTEPRLYVYDQEFEVARAELKRRAVFGALRLEEWDKGIVLPHEETGASGQGGPARLLQATRVHLSPIMALYERDAVPPIPDGAIGQPVLDARLRDERHTLRPLTRRRRRGFLQRACRTSASTSPTATTATRRRSTTATSAAMRPATWTGEEPENFILAALISTTTRGSSCCRRTGC